MGLNICEIFYSLQGESTFAGLPCVFIRLSGCNLNCSWCDTPYAQTESTPLSIDQILDRVNAFKCNLVEITGGEPLLQEDTPALARRLITEGFSVLVETNGSRDIGVLPQDTVKIIDIKCPSSNEAKRFLDTNITRMSDTDEVKFVIGSRSDYDYAKTVLLERLTDISASKVHFSPVSGKVVPSHLAEWILKDNLQARLTLQQHKIIWDPDKRGV